MFRKFLLAALMASLLGLLAAEAAQAQRYGRGGVSIGIGLGSGGYGYGRGGYGGYGYGGYGYRGYGGYPYGGYGYGYPGYYRSGVSIGIGGSPYGYGYYDPYAFPRYAPRTAYIAPSYVVTPRANLEYYSQPAYSQPAYSADEARIRVTVPSADARVWLDDYETRQKGTQRSFSTPSLTRDRTYSYSVKATWEENGKEVSRTRQVDVKAGQETAVDFSQAAPPASKKVPLPD
jgi:uncharacterized protein (TIGR03000 family)